MLLPRHYDAMPLRLFCRAAADIIIDAAAYAPR